MLSVSARVVWKIVVVVVLAAFKDEDKSRDHQKRTEDGGWDHASFWDVLPSLATVWSASLPMSKPFGHL
jgi:hypothetical protein